MSNKDPSGKAMKNGSARMTRQELKEALTEKEMEHLKQFRDKFDSRVLYGTRTRRKE